MRKKGISGLKADGTINASWTKFKLRLNLYSSDPIQDWNEYNFLGHILKRYKDHMGIDFTLSYSGAPSSCKEMYCVKRMLAELSSSDSKIVKDYIDFVYDSYIIPGKVSISSLAYFFTVNFIFEFKKKFRKESKISRASKLPPNYQNVIDKLHLDVCTYGDLAFAKLAIGNDPENPDLEVYSNLFKELQNVGFDNSILERIDGN